MAKIEIFDTVYRVRRPYVQGEYVPGKGIFDRGYYKTVQSPSYEVDEISIFDVYVLSSYDNGELGYEYPVAGWDLHGYPDCLIKDIDTGENAATHYGTEGDEAESEIYFYSDRQAATDKATQLNVALGGDTRCNG